MGEWSILSPFSRFLMVIGIDVRPLMHGRTSGVENYIRSLLLALLELDADHSYVLFYNSYRDCSAFVPALDGRKVKAVRTRYPNKLLNLCWRFLKWPKIDRLIEKRLGRSIDVFFVPDPRPTPLSKAVKKVTTFHDLAFARFPQHFSWRSRLWFKILCPEREVMTSDHLIAVSDFTRHELQDFYSVLKERITVIPEAVPGVLKPMMDPTHLQNVRQKYQLPERFFLTFSTIEPRKNLESVMKAFSFFQKKYPLETYRLVLAGRRDPKMFGKVFIEEHPDIFLCGFIEEADKAAVYSLARALIFVSTYEGFGLPVLEGMSCGTPVIASNVASMPEVAGEAALLVDPYDIEQIAEAMQRLTVDEVYQDYSQKGFDRVKEFSWKKAARATLKVLEGVAAA